MRLKAREEQGARPRPATTPRETGLHDGPLAAQAAKPSTVSGTSPAGRRAMCTMPPSALVAPPPRLARRRAWLLAYSRAPRWLGPSSPGLNCRSVSYTELKATMCSRHALGWQSISTCGRRRSRSRGGRRRRQSWREHQTQGPSLLCRGTTCSRNCRRICSLERRCTSRGPWPGTPRRSCRTSPDTTRRRNYRRICSCLHTYTSRGPWPGMLGLGRSCRTAPGTTRNRSCRRTGSPGRRYTSPGPGPGTRRRSRRSSSAPKSTPPQSVPPSWLSGDCRRQHLRRSRMSPSELPTKRWLMSRNPVPRARP